MPNAYLKVPKIEDLHYRQEWMKDPKTMSYNAGYDMKFKGYDKATGTITKTDQEMITWYNNWINKEPDKYFAYIYNNEIVEPIGEVYYYLDNGIHSMGIVIQDKYRGKGFSKIALELLCEIAKQNGITEIYDTFESDRINVIKIFENVGFKLISKGVIKKFDKDLETFTMMKKL
jgi:RimJ/RimL family protein N-acetyltransferase